MIPNYKKIEEDIKNGKIIPFEKIFAKQLEDGVFTLEEFNEGYKKEMEENDRLLRQESARKVRAARLQNNFTQDELARKLNTSKAFISEIENGKRNITIEYASKIAKALNKEFVWRFQ